MLLDIFTAPMLSFNLERSDDVVISFFDIQGKEILTHAESKLSAGVQKVQIDLSNLSAGIYLCKLQSSHAVAQRLVVKEN